MDTKHIVVAIVAAVCLLLLGLIGREIFYAVNPDKRPLKRKRRGK